MTSERFNLVSHDTVTFEPLTFCKRSFRLLWMKPSRCTWPSHSSLGHGINQTFIAGNSLQISACHVYQSVWQMKSPLPRATAIFGRVSLSWFLGRARPGALRSGVPCQAFHPRVPSGDWLRGNSFGINSPPPFLPNYLNVFYQPWPTLEVHEVRLCDYFPLQSLPAIHFSPFVRWCFQNCVNGLIASSACDKDLGSRVQTLPGSLRGEGECFAKTISSVSSKGGWATQDAGSHFEAVIVFWGEINSLPSLNFDDTTTLTIPLLSVRATVKIYHPQSRDT